MVNVEGYEIDEDAVSLHVYNSQLPPGRLVQLITANNSLFQQNVERDSDSSLPPQRRPHRSRTGLDPSAR